MKKTHERTSPRDDTQRTVVPALAESCTPRHRALRGGNKYHAPEEYVQY